MRAICAALALALLVNPVDAGFPNGQSGNSEGGYSGYHLGGGACSPVCPGPYTEVSATWRIPTITYDTSVGPTSAMQIQFSWVGISDTQHLDLVQAGGIEYFSDTTGVVTIYPFEECYPAAAVQIMEPLAFGDVVKTTITCTANCTVGASGMLWQIVMQDFTQNWTYTHNNFSCTVPNLDHVFIGIENGATQTYLPNYGTIPFVNVQINNANPGFTTANELYFYNEAGASHGRSNPSDPNATTDGFNLCWGYGATQNPNNPGWTTCSNTPSLPMSPGGQGLGF